MNRIAKTKLFFFFAISLYIYIYIYNNYSTQLTNSGTAAQPAITTSSQDTAAVDIFYLDESINTHYEHRYSST